MKLSGTPRPGLSLQRSSPIAAAALQAFFDVALIEHFLPRGEVSPYAGETIGLQFEPTERQLACAFEACCWARNLLVDAEHVLDVMADFVSHHVRLREVARRAEALVQFAEKRKVEVDLAVGGTVERPRCR